MRRLRTLLNTCAQGRIDCLHAVMKIVADLAHHQARFANGIVDDIMRGNRLTHIIVIPHGLPLEEEARRVPVAVAPVGIAVELLVRPVFERGIRCRHDVPADKRAVLVRRCPDQRQWTEILEPGAHAGRGAHETLAIASPCQRIIRVAVDEADTPVRRYLVDDGDMPVRIVDHGARTDRASGNLHRVKVERLSARNAGFEAVHGGRNRVRHLAHGLIAVRIIPRDRRDEIAAAVNVIAVPRITQVP